MEFNDFANHLFSLHNPLPNSIGLDIDFGEDNTTMHEVLYALFKYGYRNKYTLEPITEEEGIRRLEHLRIYFEAIGFKLVLLEYTKSAETGLVTNFGVKFDKL